MKKIWMIKIKNKRNLNALLIKINATIIKRRFRPRRTRNHPLKRKLSRPKSTSSNL